MNTSIAKQIGTLLLILAAIVAAYYLFFGGLIPNPLSVSVIPVPTEVSEPSRPAYEGCIWKLSMGAGLKLFVQECDFGTRKVRVAPSETLPGYLIEHDDGQGFRAVADAIQIFRLNDGQTIDDLLPQAAGKDQGVLEGASCAFASYGTSAGAASPAKEGVRRFQLIPTGETAREYQDWQKEHPEEVPEPPCGRYGISAEGSRYFEIQDAHPQTVIFVEIGQEAPLFDESSIEALN